MVPWVQTIRLKGHCSRSAHRRLDDIFAQCCELYNACLESWKGTYRWWKEHHPDEPLPLELNQSHYDRLRMFTDVRKDHPEWQRLSLRVGRGTLRRFDRSIQAFYKRCKDPSKKAGFPRFKPRHRWKSIEIVNADRAMLKAPGERKNHSEKWWRLQVKGVPQIRFEDKHDRLTTALESGRLVELRVARTPLRVEIHAVIKHPDRPPVADPVNPVGLDKGLKSRLVTSDGEHLPPTTVDLRQALRAQRRFSRSVKGSRSRIKKRKHSRQTAPPPTGTGHPVGLPPGRPPGQGLRRHSCRKAQYRRTAENQAVLQTDVTATLGILRSHTGTQSRESWCPLCGGKPSPHLHRLFPMRASPKDAPQRENLPVRTVWTDHVQRPQCCNQHMRPRLSHLGSLGSGGT